MGGNEDKTCGGSGDGGNRYKLRHSWEIGRRVQKKE
jgi:hypothetical protein